MQLQILILPLLGPVSIFVAVMNCSLLQEMHEF